MSDPSLKRSLLFSFLTILAASGAFAATPSARFETRMVWDAAIHRAVLFGGLTGIDAGTKLAYDLGDTWQWTGTRWIEQFPAHSPTARAAHAMVYDSLRGRVVIFGGRRAKTNLNDTWSYNGTDWTQIQTATSPSVRELASAAYDSVRDRIVLFGGSLQTYTADGKGVSETPLHDTWEFDGTNWKQILSDGPAVVKPILEYDPIRKQTVMLAADTSSGSSVTVMYAWDPAAAKWNKLTPTTLPACVIEGEMTWQSSNNTILYTGGVCSDSLATEDTLEWDGTNWTKIELVSFAGRYFGSALTFDPDHQVAVMFGGGTGTGVILAGTLTYFDKNWTSVGDNAYPVPRSLHVFATDPVRNVIELFGGLNDSTTLVDLWAYQNGQLKPQQTTNQPTNCASPLASFDTDRQKLVMFCEGSTTWEFDGATWTQYDPAKTAPPQHRFASMVYDQTLKKTVFFGGYDGVSLYLNQTWLFDGTAWTQVKKNPAPFRSHAAMWWDPITKKTVLYGGLGRLTSNDRLTRFSDMWSFDGVGWTEIKPSTTPGPRYGASVAVDPKTNHAIVFGGIRVDTDATNNQVQVYANDTWDWDGTNWTKVTTAVTPPPRENAGFALDPLRNELVLFGGYSGFYLSDLWSFSNGQWKQITEVLNRRRAAH
jgi:N-acetylneuraminic acid mutarotase